MAPDDVKSNPDALSASLKGILQRGSPFSLLPADLSTLLTALITTTQQPRTLALAVFARALTPSPSSTTLASVQGAIEFRLSGTDSREVVEALACLSAVLQVAPHLAVDLLKDGPIRGHLEDAMLLISAPRVKPSGERARVGEQRALVELLALSAGQSRIRAVIRASAGPWLESLLGAPGQKETGTADGQARVLAALAVVKLRLGTEKPEEGGQVPAADGEKDEKPSAWTFEELTKLLTAIVADAGETQAAAAEDGEREAVLAPALEALAYLTIVPDPTLKELLVSSEDFLRAFLSLLPAEGKGSSSLAYAVGSVLANLVAFPPAEDAGSDAAQIARLKSFAEAKKKQRQPVKETPERESAAEVTKRIERLLSANPPRAPATPSSATKSDGTALSPIPTIQKLCASSSAATRRLAGKILLSLVTPKELRGRLLQDGVAKMLLNLARQFPAPFSSSQDMDVVQALAKLLITTNPILVFGPTPTSPQLLEAVGVVALGLVASEEAAIPLLVQFECLMALTNISSLDPDLAGRIAASKVGKTGLARDGGREMLVVVNELILADNAMVRRAATELMCNLVCSQAGFDFYEPQPLPEQPKDGAHGVEPSSRLHLLLALSSSQDVPTRLAASGALTSIAMSPTVGLALALYPRGLEIILALLVAAADEDVDAQTALGLRHRALDVLASVARAVAQTDKPSWKEEASAIAAKAKVREVLSLVVQRESNPMVKEAGVEALEGWASL